MDSALLREPSRIHKALSRDGEHEQELQIGNKLSKNISSTSTLFEKGEKKRQEKNSIEFPRTEETALVSILKNQSKL